MDDELDDVKPTKRINLRTLSLVAAMVVVIAIMAFYSAQSRSLDQSQSLHVSLSDVSLAGGRLSANIMNDGVIKLDVESVQISEGSLSCRRLPKGMEPGDSASMRCTATGIEAGSSYMLIVNVKDVDSESTYRTSSYVIAKS